MNILELKGEYLEASKIQAANEDMLLAKKNVTGLAISHKVKNDKETGEVSLTIFVESKLDKALLTDDDLIPSKIGAFKTDVIETGTISALSQITLANKVRPVKGGYSVGHYKITAGTIATCVKDSIPSAGITNKYYILSNNHVLANSNDALLGDAILQPGHYDGGINPDDVVAHLSRYVPLNFSGGDNIVDCAIAEGDFDDLDREIFWAGGNVAGMTAPTVGMLLQKTGRTSGHTTGRITSVNATVNVGYGSGRVAKFVHQITTNLMGQPGDSGSLMLNSSNNQAVGLLFAGSASMTIACPIKYVMSSLGIRFI